MVYLALIHEFLKMGLFSIGGGFATLPFLYRLADNYPWFTKEMLIDMIAISQSTPGPVGLNMATYAGYSAGGAAGGVVASLALVTPSILLILLVIKIFEEFRGNRSVQNAFYGIRPAVAALIASASCGIINVTLIKAGGAAGIDIEEIWGILNYERILLFFVILYLTKKFNKHPVYYIFGAALAGAIFRL
jgi:chromate transporter